MNHRETRISPIFVVGCGRSGTTLLRLLLTCHPEICIPPESPFIAKLHPHWHSRILDSRQDVELICGDLYACDGKFLEWRIDRAALVEELCVRLPVTYAEFVDTVYRQFARQSGKPTARWGDKNPSYIHQLTMLAQQFPSARFVHIKRDGRAVLNSFRAANDRIGATRFPNSPFEAAVHWGDAIHEVMKFRDCPSFMEIRYEDLVRSPELVLSSVCQFLGHQFDPQMLLFPAENAAKELVPRHRLAWHEATLGPIDPARSISWTNKVTLRDQLAFELIAGAELIQSEYQTRLSISGSSQLNSIVIKGVRVVKRNATYLALTMRRAGRVRYRRPFTRTS